MPNAFDQFDGPNTFDQFDAGVEQAPGFGDRVGADLDERFSEGKEILGAFASGEQGMQESAFQMAGKVGAGSVLDVVGEGIVSLAGEDNLQKLGKIYSDSASQSLLFGPIKKLVDTAVDSYREFAESNSRASRNVDSAANLALLVNPVKAKPGLGANVGTKVAKGLDDAATRQTAAMKSQFVEGLVTPKDTVWTRIQQVGRTREQGLLRQKVTELSPKERSMADTVAGVKGVKSSKSLQGNYNAINDAVTEESVKLRGLIRRNNVPISPDDVKMVFDDVVKKLEDDTLLVGDAEKVAQKVLVNAERIFGKHPDTSAGLLAARKELDAFIRSQKGGKIFDPVKENAQTIAVREVRTSMNDLLAAKNPNVAVKESLKKQSNLLSAMENIGVKAGHEGSNVMMRLWRRALATLPLRGELAQFGALVLGVGGLGASAIMGPVITKAAFATGGGYLTYRLLTGPGSKRALSKLVGATDKMIALETNKAVIEQLRADRAFLVEMIKNSEEAE